jgi:hypothetical protein
MFRIDSDGAVEVIPTEESAGATAGFFGRGNPGLGVRATKVSADWLNAVQEELLEVIEDAGLTASKTNRTQLLEAIEILGARSVAGAKVPGWTQNIGFSYSAGTFTVNDASGSALSPTNPGYIALQDRANPGRIKIHTITANQSFIDDAGASEIIGNRFGVTTGVAWAEDVPFFIYAVTNDDENAIAFMLSRDPRATVAPVEASIGAPDDPVANAQGDFFSFDSLNEGLYDGNPCAPIGAIRMRMSASDDWTVQTLSTKDGVGRFHESTRFTMPAGQMGAVASRYMKLNGAVSVPQWSTSAYFYWLKKDGTVHFRMTLDGDGGTDGNGTQEVVLTLPLLAATGTDMIAGTVRFLGAGTETPSLMGYGVSETGMKFIASATGSALTYNNLGSGGRRLSIHAIYPAFED